MLPWTSGGAHPPTVSMLRQNCRLNPATSFTSPSALPMGFSRSKTTPSICTRLRDYYAPVLDSGIRWDDPAIAISWPCKDADMIISDKDRRLALLKDFNSPFRAAASSTRELS